MARATYVEIPEAQIDLYWGALQPGDRYVFSRVVRKNVFFSREKIAGLTLKSYLPVIKELWAGFTTEQKATWKSIDPHPQKHGWRTFVADQSKRIKLGLPGTATPNSYHQDMVGAINIEAPAEEAQIVQLHPSQYWVYTKVYGKKSMYQPVSVTELMALPLKITINYKSDLVSTGAGSFAKFYAEVRHFYQGQNLDTNLEIDIPLSSGWATEDITLSSVLGEVSSYNLYIHLYKVTGTLLFDNVKAEHSAQNWVRDIYCKNIAQQFTRAFYQIPKNWAASILPAGADYDSIYPE